MPSDRPSVHRSDRRCVRIRRPRIGCRPNRPRPMARGGGSFGGGCGGSAPLECAADGRGRRRSFGSARRKAEDQTGCDRTHVACSAAPASKAGTPECPRSDHPATVAFTPMAVNLASTKIRNLISGTRRSTRLRYGLRNYDWRYVGLIPGAIHWHPAIDRSRSSYSAAAPLMECP